MNFILNLLKLSKRFITLIQIFFWYTLKNLFLVLFILTIENFYKPFEKLNVFKKSVGWWVSSLRVFKAGWIIQTRNFYLEARRNFSFQIVSQKKWSKFFYRTYWVSRWHFSILLKVFFKYQRLISFEIFIFLNKEMKVAQRCLLKANIT